MFKTIPVMFLSENIKISGTIYSPVLNFGDKLPGMVLCQGFAGTKEMLLPAYAEEFAKNGYIVLTFDYRGFGESDGEVGRLVPKLQCEDIQNAITFLSTFDSVDANRIGLWGTSYGGANAIVVASSDKRVKCLSVQLTFGDGERCITSNMSTEDVAKLKETLARLYEKKTATGKEMMVPVSKILTDEQSKIFLQENSDKFPSMKIKIPFLTILETLNYKPEGFLKDLHIPILIIGAEKDLVNPISETYSLYQLAAQPKELVVIDRATHFELYSGEYFKQSVSKQIVWFKRYL
jgi:uncharacterized protein